MNVTLPSWDELDSGMPGIRFTPVQALNSARSHSLASLHLSSSGSPSDARKHADEEKSQASDESVQLSPAQPTQQRIVVSPRNLSAMDARLKKYQEAVVEMASALDLMCGHIEHALATDTSGGNLEQISAVLQARLANVRTTTTLPIESLRTGFDRTCKLVGSLAEQFFEGAITQRKLYQQEITRIQEVANMATRRAVAAQREQSASQMEQLKTYLGTENARLLEETRAKYQQCQEANRFYEAEVNRLTIELKQQEQFRQELLQQQDMQSQRMLALHNENWKQKQAEVESRYATHLDAIKSKLQNKMHDIKQKYEQQLALERNQFAKREDEMSAERSELRRQVAQLTEQLAHSASEIEALAKRQKEGFMAEREQLVAFHEEKLKEAQLNHFQLLAAVKEQAANQVTAVQNEALREQRRREAVYKAELQRAIEQAKLSQESAIQEVRLEAENKAQREKILRDSEIRRLTQANQRLQRLLDQKEARESRLALETPLNEPTNPATGLVKELDLSSETSEEDSVGEVIPPLKARLSSQLKLEEPRRDPFLELERSSDEAGSEARWGVIRIALKEQVDAKVGEDAADNTAEKLDNTADAEFRHMSHLDHYLANEDA